MCMVPYFNFISNTVMALGHSGKKKNAPIAGILKLNRIKRWMSQNEINTRPFKPESPKSQHVSFSMVFSNTSFSFCLVPCLFSNLVHYTISTLPPPYLFWFIL